MCIYDLNVLGLEDGKGTFASTCFPLAFLPILMFAVTCASSV